MDLLGRIDGWGARFPDRPAHISGARTLTYGALCRRADALAAHLARVLPDDGTPVAVCGHKEPEMLIAFLGAVKAGHPYIPLDTSLPPARIAQIVAAAGARLTLTPASVAALPAALAAPPARRIGPADPYYIIFTSGSTGEPKGVVITLECLTTFVDWMLADQAFAAPETFLNQAPFSFDLSVMDLYLSLATGGTLCSITAEEIANPKQLYAALAASGVTTWVSTPSFAQLCLAERRFAAAMLPGVRRFLFCGETLVPDVAAQLLARFPQATVWNMYGPTEATVATTAIRVDAAVLARYAPLPVGYALPAGRVLIQDAAGQPAAAGARGEIVIAGPNVSPGYLGRPDLTAQAFFALDGQRAYRTGDAGRLVDGLLFFDGRLDNQVKLHGYRIELGDVEAHLHALPGIREAVVIPVVKGGQVDSLAAFVILDPRPAGSDFALAQALRAQLAARLPAYMVPRKFRFLDALPLTANGKADRRRLAESLA
ncbi:MAG TPA: D-alanine--poly(phosphoribitol) ligase subunit DltA [Chloroflexia bacterium]|nr:D-alanine--poly(phosphoribitol) ligase subunit DltA [Chloroflexia bacterium]